MIPQAHITAWRAAAPWGDDAQVEQDLVLSRAVVEIFAEPALARALALRGGTALNKLFIQPPSRYSEDIDLVQARPGAIGDVLNAIRHQLDLWLGRPRRSSSEASVTLMYRFESEVPPVRPLRLKIEINTREHFAVRPTPCSPAFTRSRACVSVCWRCHGGSCATWRAPARPLSRPRCWGTPSAASGGAPATTAWSGRARRSSSRTCSAFTCGTSRRHGGVCRRTAGCVPSPLRAGTCSASARAGPSRPRQRAGQRRSRCHPAPNRHHLSPAVAPKRHHQRQNEPSLREYKNQKPPAGGRWFLPARVKSTPHPTCATSRLTTCAMTSGCGACCGRRSAGDGFLTQKRTGCVASPRRSTPCAWAHATPPGCSPGCCNGVAGASSRARTRSGHAGDCGGSRRAKRRSRTSATLSAS